MAEEIINRVANSSLITFDLEDYYPEGERMVLDLKEWLYEGFVLREKEFRQLAKDHNWSAYTDAYVAITCSSDAIIPAWASLLITIHLEPFAKRIRFGSLAELETSIYQDVLSELNIEQFIDKPIIIKGCANKPVPANAYIMAAEKLKPVAKSIMYGEACSAVPLYKKPK